MSELRWLSGTDLVEWGDLRREALALYPSAFLTTLAEFEARSDRQVMAQLEEGRTLGAFEEDRLHGAAAYIRHNRETTKHRADIASVYIRKESRGRGIADALMDRIEARARDEGVSQLELQVESKNLRAIRFYERRGFKRFGTFPGVVKVQTGLQDDYFYVKTLEA